MATRNPLNEAVIAQVIEDLRNGQLHRCRALGFGDAEINAMKRPEMAFALANAQIQWCTVAINLRAVRSFLNGAGSEFCEVELVDRYLKAGASTDMISQWHGFTHHEVAVRRQILGWSVRKGRPTETTAEEDSALWKSWNEAIDTGDINPADESQVKMFALEYAEERQIPMAAVWTLIQEWIKISRG